MGTSEVPSARPRMGWLCSYTPVEIAAAAGYLPVRISGGERLPRAQDPRIYHLLCPYVRAVFHRHLIDEHCRPQAVTFVRCCDAMLRLHDVWTAYVPGRAYFLDLPKISTPNAVEYFAQVLRDWAEKMAPHAPRKPTSARLWEAIGSMNRARALFRRILSAQNGRSCRLPYSRFHAWTRRWLEEPTKEILEEIRREWDAMVPHGAESSGRPRVLVTSSMLDQQGLIRLIEDAGLDVAVDDECMGARHFDGDVREAGDPYLALADRYLNKWPCPRMKGHGRRMEQLDRLIEEEAVQGVIALQLKFCDQSAFDTPLLRKHLERKGIPLLIVENDYGEGSSGQIRVRIEAFAEMLDQSWS